MSSVAASAGSSTSTSQPTQSSSSTTYTSTSTGSTGGFYRNLFYILIGLLIAFGIVSFLSLLRARRRRATIIQEAERLGVLVPGSPGYVPLRDRIHMKWCRHDGREAPDWWEVEGKSTPPAEPMPDHVPARRTSVLDENEFHPLSVIPPVDAQNDEPVPISELPYFPNHLAYRPESLLPPPSRFLASDLSTLDDLQGQYVEIQTIIQMPTAPWPDGKAVDETEEVVREWGGVEIGLVKLEVGSRSAN